MTGGPRFVSRTFLLVVLSLSLLMLSSAASVAVAQQRPNEFRNGIADDSTFGVRVAAPADAGLAVATTALDALSAAPREAGATSDKVTGDTPAHHRVPVVTDWSTKHVVFAKPRTAKDAARLEHDTRYKMQVARRNAPTFRKLADARVNSADLLDRFRNRARDPHTTLTKADAAHRDWSVSLNGATVTTPQTPYPPWVGDGQFPAKYSFDINAAPDCINDFAVYNTNTSLLVAFNNLYSGTDSTDTPNGTCTDGDGDLLSAPTVMWAYNVNEYSDGVTPTSVTLSGDGTQVAFIESASEGAVLHILKWSASDGGTVAVPATPINATGNLTAWATCGGTNPGCIWNVPFSVDWTISPGGGRDVSRKRSGAFSRKPTPDNVIPAVTPPTDTYSAPYYDYDADIIYVGTDTANVHQFVNIFNGGTTAGPSENATGDGFGGWPVFASQATFANQVTQITGPIEDGASGRIFVSDAYGDLLTIETNTVPHIAGACFGQPGPTYQYPCLADGFYDDGWNGITDPPVVDSSLGTVMVFSGSNQVNGDPDDGDAFAAQSLTTGTCVCGDGEEGSSSFVYADFGPAGGLGFGATMHDGDFDNSYYNSDGTPGSVAGFMYVCAIDPLGAGSGGNTALRQLSFNANGLLSGVSSAYLEVATSPYDECSPVTEIYNTNTNIDLMFFSVQNHSVACSADGLGGGGWPGNAPAGGCLMSFNVTNDASEAFPALVTAGFAAFLPVDGGTSGIIIDNISPDPQASSVYFTPLGDPYYGPGDCTITGCAAKATQVGLN